jgi:hypothetical protein
MKRWIAIGILVIVSISLVSSTESTLANLETTQGELLSTQSALAVSQSSLESTQKGLESAQADLASTSRTLSLTQSALASTQDNLASLNTEYADLQTSYDGLMTGHGYTITDPTYRQMQSFLVRDRTDSKQYVAGEYECRHFAQDVCNKAEAEGIRCAYVSIGFSGGTGHAIVAFNTIDRGLIYIEPQTDDEMNIRVGIHYWQSGSNFARPDYDDTITEILVIW